MSKRLVAKLAVTVAALSAITLLSGCYGELGSDVLQMAWTPYNAQMPYATALSPSQTAAVSASQNGGTASAGAGGGGGGGNQVSGGTALSQ